MIGCAANDEADELALAMLGQALTPLRLRLEQLSADTLAAEVVERVRHEGPVLVVIVSLPPAGLATARYLCKRLRAVSADLKILVGCWGLTENVERTRERLTQAGADQVGTTLLETRTQLSTLHQVLTHTRAKNEAPVPVS
jgi:hypothetical protein